MSNHIFLIGFMGCGKTHWGRLLAAELNRPFIDLDDVIVGMSGRSIPETFKIEGEAAFRLLERKALLSLDGATDAVVATGGGTPCFHDNLAQMKQMGKTVYLKTPADVLAARLEPEKAHRPLISKVSGADLPQFIEELLAKRAAFYEGADQIMVYEMGKEPAYLHRLCAIVR